MRKAGDVTYADAHKKERNQGIVEFASRRDMERAIDKFDNYELNGRKIKVCQIVISSFTTKVNTAACTQLCFALQVEQT